jgi:hypothetical protein
LLLAGDIMEWWPVSHLVEPLHDHVGQVLMQHGRRDDHLIESLVVTPDGKICGLLLLTAAERDTGAIGK